MIELDQRAILAAAIANAIMRQSELDDGSILIDHIAARHALAAMLIEGEPDLNTDAKLEQGCQLLAAETLIQAKAMRRRFEETGHRAWDGAASRRH